MIGNYPLTNKQTNRDDRKRCLIGEIINLSFTACNWSNISRCIDTAEIDTCIGSVKCRKMLVTTAYWWPALRPDTLLPSRLPSWYSSHLVSDQPRTCLSSRRLPARRWCQCSPTPISRHGEVRRQSHVEQLRRPVLCSGRTTSVVHATTQLKTVW